MLLATFLGVGFGDEEPLGTNNGGKFGDFGGSFLVDRVIFRSVYKKKDEYSVARLGLIGWRRKWMAA